MEEGSSSKETTPFLPSISSTLLSSVHPVFYPQMSALQLPLASGHSNRLPQLCYYTMPFYFPSASTHSPFHVSSLSDLQEEAGQTGRLSRVDSKETSDSEDENSGAAEAGWTTGMSAHRGCLTSPDTSLIFKEVYEKPDTLSVAYVLSETARHNDGARSAFESESSLEHKPKLTEAEKDLLRAAHSSFSSAPYPLSPPHSSLVFSTPPFSQSPFHSQPSLMYLPPSHNTPSHPVPYGQPFSLSSSFSAPFPTSPSLSAALSSPPSVSPSVKPSPTSSNKKSGNNPTPGTVYGDYGGSSSRGVAKRRANLSKVATDRLKQWLFENLSHPYPTEEEKATLCHETGLHLEQVCNWFINARRRIVQPMLEKAQKGKAAGELLNDCVLLSKKSEKKRKTEETDSDDQV